MFALSPNVSVTHFCPDKSYRRQSEARNREEDYEKAHQGERSCLLPLHHAVGRAALGERGLSASEGGEGCVAPKEPAPDTRLKAYALGGGPGKGGILAE